MILVLACFDLAVVVVFHPLTIVEILQCWQFTRMAKVQYVQHLFVFSLTALLTMTGERCLTLVYPFFHQKFVTKLRLMAIFVLCQLPFGLLHLLRIDNLDTYIKMTIAVVSIGTVLILILCLNYKISFIARTIKNCMNITLGNLNGTALNLYEAYESKVIIRRVSTCLLAVTCLLFCYCPVIAFFILVLTGVQEEWSDQTLCIVQLWIRTLITLNSSLNCLICFYKNSVLRREGKNMLEKYFPRIKRMIAT